jgi:hypothetical protein
VGLVHLRSAGKSALQSYRDVKAGDVNARAVRRAMLLMGASAAALALWFKNKDEKWWKEQTDEEKRNWLRLNEAGYRMPIGTELGQVAIALPIAAAEAIHAGSSEPLKQWLYGMIEQLTPLSRQKLPPLLKLALEQAGMDTGSGGKVVPRYLEHLPATEQVKGNTTATATAIGRATGASPVRIEHAADTLTGGSFRRLAGTAEQPFRSRESEPSDLPLVGQFIDELVNLLLQRHARRFARLHHGSQPRIVLGEPSSNPCVVRI